LTSQSLQRLMNTKEMLEAFRHKSREANALTDPEARRQAQTQVIQLRNSWVNALAQSVLATWVQQGWQAQTIRQAFWFNHFNVHAPKGEVGAALSDYWQVLLDNSTGAFGQLLLAAVSHPAMLVYLDNTQNRSGRLNENLARELLELHTLGRDGGYGQQDVQESPLQNRWNPHERWRYGVIADGRNSQRDIQ